MSGYGYQLLVTGCQLRSLSDVDTISQLLGSIVFNKFTWGSSKCQLQQGDNTYVGLCQIRTKPHLALEVSAKKWMWGCYSYPDVPENWSYEGAAAARLDVGELYRKRMISVTVYITSEETTINPSSPSAYV